MALVGYQELAQVVAESGVDTIFGVMGEGNLNLISYWSSDLGLRYVAARHESGAVSMATGYAQTSGNVGVCTVTHGPGLSNALTSLRTAANGRLPVLLLAGELPAELKRNHTQHIDQKKVVEASGADFVEVDSIHTGRSTIVDPLRRLRAGSNSIVINFPTDSMVRHWPKALDAMKEGGPDLHVRVRPDPAAIERAIALLSEASNPIIIGGRGAHQAGAAESMATVAEHLAAPLATSLLAKGLFAGHPLEVGIAGGFSQPFTQTLFSHSDCVLALGASLNHWTTMEGQLFPDATVISGDTDPLAIGAQSSVSLGVVGDARATAECLAQGIREATEPRISERDDLVDRLNKERRALVAEADISSGGRRAMTELNRLLPEERTVVVDGGHFMGYPCQELDVPDPRGFVWTSMFGSIGLGLGTGVGAALGDPERTTLTVVGDGGIMMNWSELDTAVRLQLPLIVAIMNDQAYGAEVHFLRDQGLPGDIAEFATPDLAAIARSFGAEAFTVSNPALDLQNNRSLLDAPDGPVVIDIRLDKDDIAPWFRAHLG